MGAETFLEYRDLDREDETLEECFQAAVDQAEHYYGHAGYTGTLAEKSEVVEFDDVPAPVSLLIAEELANVFIRLDDYRISDKWGPAGALRVQDEINDGWLFFGWASS